MSLTSFHNVGHIALDERAVRSSLAAALRWGGAEPQPGSGAGTRYDASDNVAHDPDLLDAYHRHIDGLLLNANPARYDGAGAGTGRGWSPSRAALRNDALPAGVPAFPQDFEHVRAQVFAEKRTPLSGRRLFATDGSVPLGARSHRIYRELGAGEAMIVSKGSQIPQASTARTSESFGVAFVACGVGVNYFDALSTDFANLRQYLMDLALARRLVDEKINRLIWSGDAAAGLYGVLNYPHIAKMVISTPFTDASTGADIAQEVNDFLDTPMIASGSVFQPNAWLVSPQIGSFLGSRQHSLASDAKIRDFILEAQRGRISSYEIVPELAAAGPNGEDVMIAYRKEVETLAHVDILAPATLPVFQSSPFDTETVVIACTGGMISADSGNVIIGYVDVGN